jgi:hypothetical protein
MCVYPGMQRQKSSSSSSSSSSCGIDLADTRKKKEDREEDFTIALVVGAENNDHIFDERDEGEGVDDEAESSQDVSLSGQVLRISESAAVHIQWRCSDISIDDSDAFKCQFQYQGGCQNLYACEPDQFIQIQTLKTHP